MIFLRLFAGYFIQIVPFAILGLYPFSDKFRFSPRKTGIFTLALILSMDAIFTGLCCAFRTALSDNALFSAANAVFVISLFPYFFWILYAVRDIWQKKLFVFSFLLTSALSMISVCNTISTWLLRGTKQDGLPYRGVSLLVILFFTALITPLLLLILKRGYLSVSDELTKKENGYLAFLSLMLFLILASGLIFCNYDDFLNPVTLFLFTALLASVFFIYVIFFKLLVLSHKKMVAMQESDYLKHQLEIRDEQYHRFNDSIEYNRRMHHDLKHHMLTIRGLLNDGKLDEAGQYLEDCIKLSENYEIVKLCEIPVVNWIVSYYQALAKNKEIPFFIRISAPSADEISIHNADFSVLLGNLLENAVTAADTATGAARSIRLTITHSGNMLVITVDNGFGGTLKLENGHYISTKPDHIGIGLHSIENIAEKYNGGVEFTHDADVFHSSVMLNYSPDHSPQ